MIATAQVTPHRLIMLLGMIQGPWPGTKQKHPKVSLFYVALVFVPSVVVVSSLPFLHCVEIGAAVADAVVVNDVDDSASSSLSLLSRVLVAVVVVDVIVVSFHRCRCF